jgi:phosphatidylglycerol---prolipoprotein diacylglyceryl transferase
MTAYCPMPAMSPGFPRYLSIGRTTVNSYKVFLCIGIYVGILVTAALASSSGMSPLRIGLGALASALAGLIGARLYDLLVHAPVYRKQHSWRALWDRNRGGWSVFGALLTFIPVSFGAARLLRVPAALFFDHMGLGVLAGGFWIRLGCVFNGCCAGRETVGRLGVWLHDTHGVVKWRIPVQFLEMGWWLLGGVAFVWLWPRAFAPGSFALGVLGWYGVARFFLEPMREEPDLVLGTVRINQVVAALLAFGAVTALVIRGWGS